MSTQINLTARRVRQLREDLHLTQAELAARANLAPSTISGIEKGYQGISKSAEVLALTLGTTIDYLYGLTNNPLRPNEEEDLARPALLTTIVEELERLDEIDQQIILQMAMTLRLARERRSPRVVE